MKLVSSLLLLTTAAGCMPNHPPTTQPALSITSPATAAVEPAIIPRPAKMQLQPGTFTLAPHTLLRYSHGAENEAQYLQQALGLPSGVAFDHPWFPNPAQPTINLVLTGPATGEKIPTGPVDEAYTLDVTPNGATLTAATTAGLFDAIQTFRQLFPTAIYATQPRVGIDWTAPCVHIEDAPRFAYRGMHLDCCRHFFPKEFVERYIDLMSMHKFNSFHWHLTDDQGWRIQIRKYPKLTEVGAWRSQTLVGHHDRGKPMVFDGIPLGGFYTQDDIREIVAYAAARHVTVMPEIEMPGHSRAAIAAYPQLGLGENFAEPGTFWGAHGTLNVDDSTIAFYEDVLTEVMELFPSKFIHCGGDEVVKSDWTENPAMQERMRQLNISDPAQLQAHFMEKIDAFLSSKGRRMVGWDEILDGHLAPGATVMSWRGIKGGIKAVELGHDVIMTPGQYCYFDHYQADPAHEPLAIGGFLPLEQVYQFDPVPPGFSAEQARHILGAQSNLWAEYIPTTTQMEYMAYPRACALSEVLWSGPKGDYTDFYSRLIPHLQRLGLRNVNFRRLDVTTTRPSTRKAEDY